MIRNLPIYTQFTQFIVESYSFWQYSVKKKLKDSSKISLSNSSGVDYALVYGLE